MDRESEDPRHRTYTAGTHTYQRSLSAGMAKPPPSQEDRRIDDSNSEVIYVAIALPIMLVLRTGEQLIYTSPFLLSYTDARLAASAIKHTSTGHGSHNRRAPEGEQTAETAAPATTALEPHVPSHTHRHCHTPA